MATVKFSPKLYSFEYSYVKIALNLKKHGCLSILKVLDASQRDTDYSFSKHSFGRYTVTKILI